MTGAGRKTPLSATVPVPSPGEAGEVTGTEVAAPLPCDTAKLPVGQGGKLPTPAAAAWSQTRPGCSFYSCSHTSKGFAK